ncbi:phage head completion protein [Kibdelosporangium phytohabitans]|uniref:Head-tail adaptor protein n=1 Tax=Kibdelosporangium phytohabitans TaxID=860235 RepID=A0A0N9HY78_9PSEU|nr:hypothetical protein [Kibdelosporangium phytohabitans]ALG06848.1 hypothetical protein AOZ06_07805 [Kibdelosporangium phytohabitans]MBE1468095.1 hypothetical protein [Kibdelosporangium phytohabitans]
MLANLLTQTAEIFRPTTTQDRHQNQQDVWPTIPTSTKPCRLQQVVGLEDSDGRDLSISQWKLYLPADAAITEKDRVRVGADVFEVTAVYPVPSPRLGATHHLQCMVTTYSGGVAS